MKFDLLRASERVNSGESVIRDSGLDCFYNICPDDEKTRKFLEIVSAPLTEACEIIYRQEILRDFLDVPGLFERISALSGQAGEIRAALEKNRRERNSTTGSEAAQSQCRVCASLLKELLLVVKKLGKTENVRSDGLSELIDRARELSGRAEYQALMKLCGRLEYRSAALPTDIRIKLDGRIESAELVEHRFSEPEPKQSLIGRLFGQKTVERKIPAGVGVTPVGDVYERLGTIPFRELSSELDNAAKQLLEPFDDLCAALDFYEVAMRYHEFLESRGVGVVFPMFSEDERVTGLYDLKLLTEKAASEVIPRDIPRSGRIIIRGVNSSGKTVFLRSVAAARLIAQAGLPIPAECAEMRIYRRIVMLCAGGSHEDGVGDFEREVARVAEIVNSELRGTLVLLNEVFQTTAFGDGAAALSGVLGYLWRAGADYMVTTHLELGDGLGAVMEFSAGYRAEVLGK